MKVEMKINGEVVVDDISPSEKLSNYLRRKGYQSVKIGCGMGSCGTCTVLVDGKAVRSCIMLAVQCNGREITTVEGLGTPTKPHVLQECFVETGGVQCGYCTPGMILSAKALLDENKEPSDEEIKEALDGNLCRCTGYVKELEAIKLAAKRMKDKNAKPDKVEVGKFNVVGKSCNKLDSISMATGRAKYVADYVEKGALRAKILPSPYAHARIKSIDISEAEKLPGVKAVLCYKNVPRVPHTTAGQGYPEPSPYDTYLFDNKVRYVGDKVAVVAAESEEICEEALKKIKIEWEELPAVFDPKEALKEGAPIIHDESDAKVIIPVTYDPKRNLASRVEMNLGDVEKAMKEADVVVEREYYAHYAQHCPLEPHVCYARLTPDDRIEIISSTQVPFHARRITAQVLEIPVKKVRVIKPRIGGGFGAKQEVFLEPIVAMLTMRTRRPVLLEYTRKEEFVSSRTRHPIYTTVRLGAKKDGKLTAIEMKVIANTGAYGSHSLTVTSNCGSKCLPLYHADNVHFVAEGAYTNLPVAGAYRGYGATQAYFALECQMDELARKLKMDPIELRKKNAIKKGEGSKIFEILGEGRAGAAMVIDSCGLEEAMKLGAKEIGWGKKEPNKGPYRYGIGMATMMQGSSIPYIDMGAASIKMNEDGSFNLLVGATDLGTGSDTVLAQIAAEVLGVDADDIIVYSSDTDLTPFDVGAYASSTTYLSGQAVKRAADKVAAQILSVASKMMDIPQEELVLKNKGVEAKEPDKHKGKKTRVSLHDVAVYSLYQMDQFQIGAIDSSISKVSPPPFTAHFAKVRVDIETGKIDVLKYVAAVDCGTPINPALAEGQTEGAVLNGICYALTEEYVFNEKGTMLNPNFQTYKIYSMRDIPEIKTILVPTYETTGPFGAKSVSEISINGPLPVISNAVYDAIGVRLTEGPFTPEKVLKAIKEKMVVKEA